MKAITPNRFLVFFILVTLIIVSVNTSVSNSFFSSFCTFADQSGWSRTYGGTNSEYASSVIQTNDGGFAIIGWIIIPGSGGSYAADSWLVKADLAGNIQWNKTYGGIGTDLLASIVQTADGGYAMGGVTNSSGGSGGDFWLVKTDSSGNVQWNKTYGGTGHELANFMVQTSDGGFALAGCTDAGAGGPNDFWLVKTDSAGNGQWNKTYGGIDNDVAESIVQTIDGGYAIEGFSGPYSWLVRTDSAGNMQWNKTYYGNANLVIQNRNGGYILVGGYNNTALLISTDSSGTLQWNKTYAQGSEIYSGVQTPDGGYAIVGQGRNPSSYSWLAKIDSAGTLQWNQTYVEGSVNYIIQTSDGGFAMSGSRTPVLSSDFWLIKTDATGVIPEFPSSTILLLTAVTILLFVTILHRKLKPNSAVSSLEIKSRISFFSV